MFPDEVFLTLCCPKAEITEAYSIGETAINIPAPEDAPIPIEIELTSTSLIGDLKDRLNIILGEMAGFSKGEIAMLGWPRAWAVSYTQSRCITWAARAPGNAGYSAFQHKKRRT